MNIALNKTKTQPQEIVGPEVDFDQERMIEAILFASTEPLSLRQISQLMPESADTKAGLEAVIKKYENRGFRVVKIMDRYAFRTATDLGYLLQNHVIEKRKLSKAALEVLAIID